jgi:hypothetical protein
LYYCAEFCIGDLVCIKSHFKSPTGWRSRSTEPGIIIEVIEIKNEFIFVDHKTRCYDYVIYWFGTQKLETLPDIIVEEFDGS